MPTKSPWLRGLSKLAGTRTGSRHGFAFQVRPAGVNHWLTWRTLLRPPLVAVRWLRLWCSSHAHLGSENRPVFAVYGGPGFQRAARAVVTSRGFGWAAIALASGVEARVSSTMLGRDRGRGGSPASCPPPAGAPSAFATGFSGDPGCSALSRAPAKSCCTRAVTTTAGWTETAGTPTPRGSAALLVSLAWVGRAGARRGARTRCAGIVYRLWLPRLDRQGAFRPGRLLPLQALRLRQRACMAGIASACAHDLGASTPAPGAGIAGCPDLWPAAIS